MTLWGDVAISSLGHACPHGEHLLADLRFNIRLAVSTNLTYSLDLHVLDNGVEVIAKIYYAGHDPV